MFRHEFVQVNRSIPKGERDGDREYNVSYLPDPNEDYYDKYNNEYKPSDKFADPLSPIGRWTDVVESNPKTGITHTYHSDSNNTILSDRDATGRTKAPRPSIGVGESPIGNFLEAHKKYNAEQAKRRGRR